MSLTPQAKLSIQKYMVSLVAIPALVLSALSFFLGYFLDKAATEQAYQEAFTVAQTSLLRSATEAARAETKATSASDAAVAAVRQVQTLETEMKSLIERARTSLELEEGFTEGVIEGLIYRDDFLVRVSGEREARVTELEDLLNRYVSREWIRLDSSRALGTTFTNEQDYPIEVAVTVTGLGNIGDNGNPCGLQITIDDQLITEPKDNSKHWARHCAAIVTVPPGAHYVAVANGAFHNSGRLTNWMELR